MIYQPATSTATASNSTADARRQLDDVLTRLVARVAAIEADCATLGIPVALLRHRAALYAAMDALGGWINAFLAAVHRHVVRCECAALRV